MHFEVEMRLVRGISVGLASFGAGMRQVRGIRAGLVAFGAGNAASPEDSCGTSGIWGRKCG